MTVFAKDPSAILDYTLDYNDAGDPYLVSGETIATSTWTVEPGSELVIDADSNTTTTTTVTVSAGTAGNVYRLTNRIATSAGRTEERSIIIRVQER